MIQAHWIAKNSRVLINKVIAQSACCTNIGFSCTSRIRPVKLFKYNSNLIRPCSYPVLLCQEQDQSVRYYSSSSSSASHHNNINNNNNNNFIPSPQEQQEGKNEETRLRRYKKIFSSILFTSTLVLIAYCRRKKQDTLTENFEGCVRLPVDEAFHGGHREFFRCSAIKAAGQEGEEKSAGCVLPAQILKDGTVKAIKSSFEIRPDDIIVASFPKTGTTWVQEIVYLINNDLDFKKASEKVLENRFPYLEYPYPGLSSVIKQASPRLIKTHLPLDFLPENTLSTAKVIYVTRNPKDTVVSYFHFSRMLAFSSYEGSFEDFVNKFKNDQLPYCPFFGHLESYTRQDDNPNLLIVTYEDLSRNPAEVINKISRFLDKPLSESEVNLLVQHTSFKEMAKNPSVNYEHWDDLGIRNNSEAPFMRKGKVGDWRNYFTASSTQEFDAWIQENNRKGFKFEYEV